MNSIIRKRRCARAIAATIALASPLASPASPLVDWLTFGPGVDRTHFNLRNDAGLPAVQGQIDITAGLLAPLSPGAGSLQSAFWNTEPPAIDSILNDGTVSTTKIQVVPQAGAVDFQLTIQGQDLSGMVFAVGQLFGSGTAGTREMSLLTKTVSGVVLALEFLAFDPWDNGVRAYTQPLNWDGSKLTLDAAANGESEFAFFRIRPSVLPVTSLVFDIPNGYASGNGDALEFAFGLPITPVPEPGVVAMLVAGCGGVLLSRKRLIRRSSAC